MPTSDPPPMGLSPTPYPDVNAVLHLLLEQVRAILGADLVGLYLYGSLSSGDFDPVSSDIDFVVVTMRELSGEYHSKNTGAGILGPLSRRTVE